MILFRVGGDLGCCALTDTRQVLGGLRKIRRHKLLGAWRSFCGLLRTVALFFGSVCSCLSLTSSAEGEEVHNTPLRVRRIPVSCKKDHE